ENPANAAALSDSMLWVLPAASFRDLILKDGDTLVFAEVRLRSHNHYGGAAASINAAKQKRLIRTAQHYLATLGYTPPCRFDALLFHNLDNGWPEWIRNAFTA
ncbi:MAG: hypothetical protein DYH16_10130, partial [Nitrosomonas sp. PRO5]|nr:hypothetical protein [Nitrosomonas sp. PRO5]